MKINEIFQNMQYGPAPESSHESMAFLDKFGRQFDIFVNGEWIKSHGKQYYDTINPSNGQFLAKISESDKTDVNKAVQAAKKALPV